MKLRVAGALFLVGVGAAVAIACGSNGDDGDEPGLDSGKPDGGVNEGSFDGGTGEACAEYCSADRHSFLDCTGKVTRTCQPGEGCSSDGRCIPVCDAIKDSPGSIGCEFYVHHPEVWPNQGDCHAVFVVNQWSDPVSLTGEAGGADIDVTKAAYIPTGTGTSLTYTPLPGGQIPPGGVAIVFLHEKSGAGSILCPKAPASWGAHSNWNDLASSTGKSGYVLKLSATGPVAVYDIYPFGGGNSAITAASLLLPSTTWGKNYMAITPYAYGTNATYPALTVVASQDETTVTFLPTQDVVGGGGIPASAKNTATTYTLNAGEMLHFSQERDLLGSVIDSDKPIGVWGEQTCVQVETMACDSMHQQIPPIQAMGNEYVGVRYRNRIDGREESPPWRLVGMVDDTTLEWEPSAPPEAPTTLRRGQWVKFHASGPFVVRSQDKDHPFYLNAYMTGGGDIGCDPNGNVFCFDGRGDAEFVNVVPTSQYLPKYGFFTDPTYPETNLVFVRARAKDGNFKDVSLDCAKTLKDWQPIGTSGKYEYTRVDLSRGNFQPQGGCDNGRHEATSDGPFTLTVWGWGSKDSGDAGSPAYSQYVSYAYPAGASVEPVNTVVVRPIPK